jgi:hypothetical protein
MTSVLERVSRCDRSQDKGKHTMMKKTFVACMAALTLAGCGHAASAAPGKAEHRPERSVSGSASDPKHETDGDPNPI